MKEKEKKELFKELEPGIRAKMKKEKKKVYAHVMKHNTISTEIGKKSSLESTISLINHLFLMAAATLNVPVTEIFMENTSGNGYTTHFYAEILETDAEFDKRVEWAVENAVWRREQDIKVAEQQQKKYEAEIEKLTRQKEALEKKLAETKK